MLILTPVNIPKGDIPLSVVETLIESNMSLVQCNDAPRALNYFAQLNSICLELGAGISLTSFFH